MSTSPRSPSTVSPGTSGSHLEREILQQPAVWRELAAGLRGVDLRELLEPVLSRPEGRVLLVGAGTSAYAGQVAAPYLTRRLGRQVEAVATTDLVSKPSTCSSPTYRPWSSPSPGRATARRAWPPATSPTRCSPTSRTSS